MSVLSRLYHDHQGRCFYCGRETYLPGQAGVTREEASKRLGLPPGRGPLRQRRATIEHLKRVADGGTRADGIVLACAECNSGRGETPVEQWKAFRSAVGIPTSEDGAPRPQLGKLTYAIDK